MATSTIKLKILRLFIVKMEVSLTNDKKDMRLLILPVKFQRSLL